MSRRRVCQWCAFLLTNVTHLLLKITTEGKRRELTKFQFFLLQWMSLHYERQISKFLSFTVWKIWKLINSKDCMVSMRYSNEFGFIWAWNIKISIFYYSLQNFEIKKYRGIFFVCLLGIVVNMASLWASNIKMSIFYKYILQNLEIKKYKGGYYHHPSVPCAYFGVIVSGLSDENMNFISILGEIFAALRIKCGGKVGVVKHNLSSFIRRTEWFLY